MRKFYYKKKLSSEIEKSAEKNAKIAEKTHANVAKSRNTNKSKTRLRFPAAEQKEGAKFKRKFSYVARWGVHFPLKMFCHLL